MNKLVDYCREYYAEDWLDSLFDSRRIQNIIFIFSIFNLFFAHSQKQISSLPPSSPVFAIRKSIMSLFFSFSFHIKYFWKHLSVDPHSLILSSSSSSSSDFALESNPNGILFLSLSPSPFYPFFSLSSPLPSRLPFSFPSLPLFFSYHSSLFSLSPSTPLFTSLYL